MTVYKSVQDLPAFIDYRMIGGTYRYFTGKPLYGFAHGLSYTTFAYRDIRLSARDVKPGEHVRVTATVTNTGTVAGDEVAQLYLVPPANEQGPLRELVGFRRVHLRPGESADEALASATCWMFWSFPLLARCGWIRYVATTREQLSRSLRACG